MLVQSCSLACSSQLRTGMNIEELVEQTPSDFEKDKNAANYIWGQAYEKALTEIHSSLKARSIAFAETLLIRSSSEIGKSPR